MVVFKILFWAIVFIVAYKIIFAVSKRCFLILKLNSLAKNEIAAVKYKRFPFLSCLCFSKKPDAVIEAGSTIYLVRFISGIGKRYNLHFASKDFFVTYKKLSLYPAGRFVKGLRAKKKAVAPAGASTSSRRVKIMPELILPEEYASFPSSGKYKIEKVILLNPAPGEVSYVSEERTSIKAAFTGDEVNEYKIFTPSTLVTHIDREVRNKKTLS